MTHDVRNNGPSAVTLPWQVLLDPRNPGHLDAGLPGGVPVYLPSAYYELHTGKLLAKLAKLTFNAPEVAGHSHPASYSRIFRRLFANSTGRHQPPIPPFIRSQNQSYIIPPLPPLYLPTTHLRYDKIAGSKSSEGENTDKICTHDIVYESRTENQERTWGMRGIRSLSVGLCLVIRFLEVAQTMEKMTRQRGRERSGTPPDKDKNQAEKDFEFTSIMGDDGYPFLQFWLGGGLVSSRFGDEDGEEGTVERFHQSRGLAKRRVEELESDDGEWAGVDGKKGKKIRLTKGERNRLRENENGEELLKLGSSGDEMGDSEDEGNEVGEDGRENFDGEEEVKA
ncbi:hypothetical protein BDZ45DRAFT_802173 [Acephala macrosclerotiorum]|nr:hypothetical protein BDZ45DRAFT_802173 [Acephala macrosclerotiorum]